ncbi:MAG TPA: hypothetical protein DDW42_04595 [Desulfobacteraceae bacterium]|nr:hypothetical protein [Desulfobacteraceae bacterium]
MKSSVIKTAGLTEIGLKSDRNEDSFSADQDLGLFVVADGRGGHRAGDIASRMAVDLINKSYKKWKDSATPENEIFGHANQSISRTANYVLSGIRLSNRIIHEMATQYERFHGMGTTAAVLAIIPGLVISANVGDSRVYLVRNGQIDRLSKDHSLIAEQVEMGIITNQDAIKSRMKHVLTKSLGSVEDVDPEIFEIKPEKNDRFVLCSNGLTDLITDNEILSMVIREDNPEALCLNFIYEALKRGGDTNTTVVSVYL